MNPVLFIGGPKTVQGVDRIDDDLMSIFNEPDLYSRKTVVLWPTENFMEPPEPSEGLLPILKDYLARIGESRFSLDEKDPEGLLGQLVCETTYRLWKLILSVTGGQNLVVIVDPTIDPSLHRWADIIARSSKMESSVQKH